MEEALTAIRRAIGEKEVGETTLLAAAERQTSGEGARTRPDAELLSSETTAAIGSAINTLRETVKKQEPTIEEAVREALRPMLNRLLLTQDGLVLVFHCGLRSKPPRTVSLSS
jgi:cell pole-organizing protein PopZ